MTNDVRHFGRSWSGSSLEDLCPCPQQPCGLVTGADAERLDCPQHAQKYAQTMRQSHLASECAARNARAIPYANMLATVNRALFKYDNDKNFGVREMTDQLIRELDLVIENRPAPQPVDPPTSRCTWTSTVRNGETLGAQFDWPESEEEED